MLKVKLSEVRDTTVSFVDNTIIVTPTRDLPPCMSVPVYHPRVRFNGTEPLFLAKLFPFTGDL